MAFILNPFTSKFDANGPSASAYASSVSTTDPSLRVTPTTGAVVIYMFNPMFYTYYGGF